MSVNISISNDKQKNCNSIIKKLLDSGINCRIIDTISVVDNNIEHGCLITLDKKYSDKIILRNLWNMIKDDYICSHIKIDGLFDGCIYNYLKNDFCPGNIYNKD
tara:strand:+ start:268 stop:579 length:312 start_codon:yes stop_codon:yes gene_type:complete